MDGRITSSCTIQDTGGRKSSRSNLWIEVCTLESKSRMLGVKLYAKCLESECMSMIMLYVEIGKIRSTDLSVVIHEAAHQSHLKDGLDSRCTCRNCKSIVRISGDISRQHLNIHKQAVHPERSREIMYRVKWDNRSFSLSEFGVNFRIKSKILSSST